MPEDDDWPLFSNSSSDVVFKRIKSRDTVQYLTVLYLKGRLWHSART